MDWLIDEFLRDVLGLERVADVFGVLVSVAFVVSILLCVRVVWAKGTRPNAALAWIATLLALPVVGALLYLIIGENRVGAAPVLPRAKFQLNRANRGGGQVTAHTALSGRLNPAPGVN